LSAAHFGNAAEEVNDRRGWFVGHFMPEADVRRTGDVEVKWGVHPAGEERQSWQDNETRTTVLLLVQGRFRINFPDESHVLARQGDYVMWGPGVGHSWRAEEDSVVVTIRWPSRP
jgi:quercetin dioxygenase-like cupin family protein